MTKSYLLSVDPDRLNTVVSVLKTKNVIVKNVLENISVIVVSYPEDKLADLRSIDGVQSVEEEGTSYAI